ncbi:hypothetical protein IAR55_005004 [Kwoniella newhampshirensis]|uniref:Rho termination factor-like N-terminal domain-containing protein n=1 Tax=Kwoniella newhampshirensis TaxID=1651941 RepID=A0AAW0YX68_9TREE
MHEKDLQAMKVSQLKIKCKELKVPNFSKLTKAELVQRILDTETHSNRTQHAVQYDKKSSPSTVSHPKDESKKLQACQPDRRQIGGDTTISPDTIVAEEAGETHGATPQAGDIARYRQMSSTTLPGVLSTKMTSKMTTSTAHADGPTTASALLKTKGASFKAPTPKLLPQQSPLKSLTDSRPQEYTHTLNSALDRVAYIRSHFISRLLHTLNRHRSMSPPPSSAPKAENDCAYGTTKELSFQGFESGIYHTGSADDFCVALRFWISRLHVLMQLGCGEAWSTFGGGLGLLTPDLAKWPVVAGCKRISRDFWLIQTNESLTCKSGMISFIVFGLTGEVLATSTDHRRENSIEGCPVRNDWYNFIVDSPMEASIADGLLNRIKTKNVEEFPGGISRAWRRRRSDSGTGDERLLIAQRVAVASCALNSNVDSCTTATIPFCTRDRPPQLRSIRLRAKRHWTGHRDKGVNDVKQSEEFWVGWEDRTWG